MPSYFVLLVEILSPPLLQWAETMTAAAEFLRGTSFDSESTLVPKITNWLYGPIPPCDDHLSWVLIAYGVVALQEYAKGNDASAHDTMVYGLSLYLPRRIGR